MLERGERGIARPEIVERNSDSGRAQPPKCVDGLGAGLQDVFSQLDLDAFAGTRFVTRSCSTRCTKFESSNCRADTLIATRTPCQPP